MRRSVPTTIVVVVGLLLLINFVVINPTLAAVSEAVLHLLVLLAAAAAVAGAAALVMRHASDLVERRGDLPASALLLGGMFAMLVAGLYPGSQGAGDPAVRWLVAALLGPLVASLFAMLFVFLLLAMRHGMQLRSRQMRVMLAAAGVAVVLLLPLSGTAGGWLAELAAWTLAVPIGGVFRGLLIGVGVATAVQAARIMLAIESTDD